MAAGTVQWYSQSRGFGELADDETGARFYLLCTDLPPGMASPEEGQRLSFTPAMRGPAPVARDLKKIEK